MIGFHFEKGWGNESLEAQLGHGAAYFEAKDFQKAREIYQALLQEDLPPWQKAVAIYNLGCTYLEEERWNDAVSMFQSAESSPSLSPLLKRRAKGNIALAYLRQALGLSENIDPNSLLSADIYRKAIYLFRKSLNLIDDAFKAYCELEKVEGKMKCELPFDLEQNRLLAKERLAATQENYLKFQISHATLKEGVPLLLRGLGYLRSDLNFISEQNLSEDLPKKYLELIIEDADTWMPLWNILKAKSQANSEKGELEKKELDLILEAQKNYQYIIRMLEKKNIKEAQLVISKVTETLNELIRLAWGQDPIFENMQKLLNSFRNALEQNPLQEESLEEIQNEILQVEKVISTLHKEQNQQGNNPSIDAKLSASQKKLLLSMQLLKEGKENESRLFLEEGAQELKRLITMLAKPNEKTAENILETIIEEQQHALSLNRLNQKIEETEGRSPEATQLILSSQDQTIKITSSFLKAVISQQTHDFHSFPQQGKPDIRCQGSPWDAILPLFEKGVEAAYQAEKLLQNSSTHPSLAMAKQEDALTYWEKALDKLKQPMSSTSCNNKPKETNEQNPQNEEEKVQQTNFQEVLKLLQQMENDDKLPSNAHPAVSKKGFKPW